MTCATLSCKNKTLYDRTRKMSFGMKEKFRPLSKNIGVELKILYKSFCYVCIKAREVTMTHSKTAGTETPAVFRIFPRGFILFIVFRKRIVKCAHST